MAKKIGKKQRKAKRIPEPASYFLGSEGTKTEVLYFKWIADRLEKQYSGFHGRIEVPSFHIKGIGSSNLRLLDDLEEYLKSDPMLYENVWAVFDKDDVPLAYFDNAITVAANKGWHTAWSNDSFELWYLLHFEYLQSGISREQYKQKLTAHCNKVGIAKYEKNDPQLIEALYPLSSVAIRNATRLEKNYAVWMPSSQKLPCTTVYYLVQELINLEANVEQLRQQNNS